MAVKLTSDLVIDVMRNADPKTRDAAAARLQPTPRQASEMFAQAVAGVPGSSPSDSGSGMSPGALQGNIGSSEMSAGQSAYRGFERMVLRNLFETLLPEEKSGAFGGGPSAGVWRSMAADQLAGVYAASGGAGIARMLESADAPPALEREGQWPYFSVQSIRTFTS